MLQKGEPMSDLIDRQAAMDAIWAHLRNILKKVNFKDSDDDGPVRDAYKMAHQHLAEVIESLPAAEPELDEWCTLLSEVEEGYQGDAEGRRTGEEEGTVADH